MTFCGFTLNARHSRPCFSDIPDQIMKKILKLKTLLLMCCSLFPVVVLADAPKVIFEENFEKGTDRWEILDPESWQLKKSDGGSAIEITSRGSKYKPPVRSPGHVALIKDLKVGSFDITFKVRSTKDTGNHRDCCVFFGYQDDQHFYYVHLGAKPDPHSGQIMIVKEAPRLAPFNPAQEK